MRGMRWVLAMALAGYGAASGSIAAAATPDTLVLTPESPTAIVVIKTAWWRPAPTMQSAFRLILSAYDPAQQKILGSPYGGVVAFEAKKKNYADGYLLASVKPGHWVFQSYSQQDKWALCFNAATVQFDVKAGEVVYLGDFDAEAHRRELVQQAISSGRTSISSYGFADFFDRPDGPRLSPIDAGQLEAVRTVLQQDAPHVTAPVRAAEYQPARFGTGSTLFAERKCGGYFPVGAKPADKPAG